jgi:hypothetical protein
MERNCENKMWRSGLVRVQVGLRRFRTLRAAAAACLLLVCTACGDGGTPAPAGERELTPGGSNPPASDLSPDSGPAALNDADLVAYRAGIAKEIELVREAQKAQASGTPEERAAAMQAQWETATIPKGAEASGLSVDRYRQVRDTVHEVFMTLDFQDKIEGPMSIDLSRVDQATKDRLARDAFSDLPQDSAAALRAHMDRLVPLWIEYVTLTAVAG